MFWAISSVPIDVYVDIFNIFQNYHPVPWRDSISRPIAPVSSVAGGDDTASLRRQGMFNIPLYIK
jgi:hypothetical protein